MIIRIVGKIYAPEERDLCDVLIRHGSKEPFGQSIDDSATPHRFMVESKVRAANFNGGP